MSDATIFAQALEKKAPQERAAYLDEACAGDAAQRQRIEVLLRSHEQAGSFLEKPAAEATGAYEPAGEAPGSTASVEVAGTRIGPYKLLQLLGEGGMGAVYLAEQEQPVRRLVALKIIKAGMDSRQVIARFEQERQALAVMDHPNIARVLDAGTTATGRPYFVMELVKGIPITRYCDQEQLTPQQRLELFVPVCAAVQHAHQKGIIHRDLKPSNVLVALYDGKPVVKVIDFGVAKATAQRLTEQTLFTEVGQVIGTLEFMAPEQAELNNLDIDTRADIYSLGVVLYELLTGSPPFTRKQLQSVAFLEMLRIIREVEPPSPSTKLSGSEELPAIAARRKLEPKRLTKLVHGDLDWIVMKCLVKERNRRYETANALALDLERYLHDEPVTAGPPSAGYRLRKFLRRNKGAVSAVGLVLLVLIGGIIGTSWQAYRARSAEALANQRREAADQARKRAEFVKDYVLRAFRSPRPEVDGREVKVVDLLDQAVRELEGKYHDDPDLRAYLLETLGLTYNNLALHHKAVPLLEEADQLGRRLQPDDPSRFAVQIVLAAAYGGDGRGRECRALLEAVYSRCREHPDLGPDAGLTLRAATSLGIARLELGEADAGIALLAETRKRLLDQGPRAEPELLQTVTTNLAIAFMHSQNHEQAIPLYQEIIARLQALGNPDDPELIEVEKDYLNTRLHAAGANRIEPERAIPLAEEIVERHRRVYGPDNFLTLDAETVLAKCHWRNQDLKKALAMARKIAEKAKRLGGTQSTRALLFMSGVGLILYAAGDREEGIRHMKEVVDQLIARGEAPLFRTRNLALTLRNAYMEQGAYPEAIELAARMAEDFKKRYPPDHPPRRYWTFHTGAACIFAGEYAAAEKHLAEVEAAQRQWIQKKTSAQERTDGLKLLWEILLGLAIARVNQGKFIEAEASAREALAVWNQSRQPGMPEQGNLNQFGTECLIGESLLGQEKFAEAEEFLLRGYRGMKAREKEIPARGRPTLAEVLAAIVRLYEAWGQPEKAAEWRKELEARKEEQKPATPKK